MLARTSINSIKQQVSALDRNRCLITCSLRIGWRAGLIVIETIERLKVRFDSGPIRL
jgi:hypothetical protein